MTKTASRSTAVVIIPTYNERENILRVVPLLQDVFALVPAWDMHVLVVDDSSPDNTAGAVRQLERQFSNVHLLLNKQKAGLGGAYLKGMAEAFGNLKADVVFEFDADLSHDPTRIPLFLEKIEQGYEIVVGSRYIAGGGIPQNWGLHRKFLSVVGNLFIMFVLTDFRIHDWTTGYRAITKATYEAVAPELLGEQFTSYTFQTGFLHKAIKKGFKAAEVPFVFVDREVGESKLGFESVKNTLSYILRVRAQEIVSSRIFKFALTGGVGALVQLLSLKLWWIFFPYTLASFFSIETAVISNFVINNVWTFADRKLLLPELPAKFIQFNLASAGSIGIQLVIAFIGNWAFGAHTILLKLPFIQFDLTVGLVLAVVGILIGMVWNFFAYSRFVWKAKS